MKRFAIGPGRTGALMLVALLLAPMVAAAQQRGRDDDWCRNEQSGDDRGRACVVREYTVPATAGTLSVAGTNGGISVEGEARGDVRIVARISANAETDARARELVAAVQLNPTLDQVEATGPQTHNREGWSVSYRLYVPRALNMNLRTTNGGISLRDIDSKVDFRTTNGGVKLVAVNGDVKGQTTNGGVKLSVPDNYSARLEASTDNGGINIDGVNQNRRSRDITTQLGAGGAPIRVRTTNGGVRLTRK